MKCETVKWDLLCQVDESWRKINFNKTPVAYLIKIDINWIELRSSLIQPRPSTEVKHAYARSVLGQVTGCILTPCVSSPPHPSEGTVSRRSRVPVGTENKP